MFFICKFSQFCCPFAFQLSFSHGWFSCNVSEHFFLCECSLDYPLNKQAVLDFLFLSFLSGLTYVYLVPEFVHLPHNLFSLMLLLVLTYVWRKHEHVNRIFGFCLVLGIQYVISVRWITWRQWFGWQVDEIKGDDVVCVIKNSATLAGSLFTLHASQIRIDLPTLSEKDKEVSNNCFNMSVPVSW